MKKMSFQIFRPEEKGLNQVHGGEPGELFEILLAASLEPHPPGGIMLARIRQEIRQKDPFQVARLVLFLGERKHFRELSLFLSAELAAMHVRYPEVADLPEQLELRVEEVPAWLEHYRRAGLKGPGRRLRKRLASAFSRLDEYRFTHYERDLQLKIKNVLAWLRPKAQDLAQEELFRKILRDQVPVRSDWKAEWQQLARQSFDSTEIKQAAMRDKWKEGISSFRIGYLPMVENLVPILEAGVSGKVLRLMAEYLRHPAAIARSGVSPVRLLQAYRKLKTSEQGGAGMLKEALEAAVLHSSKNIGGPEKGERLVLALDVSNSMLRIVNSGETGHIPGGVTKGEIELFDIGILLAMLFASNGCQVQAGIIGNIWKKIRLPSGPTLRAVDGFRARVGESGYAVNAHLVIEGLLLKGEIADRVMVFSDYRLWEHRAFNQPAGADLGMAWRAYRRLAPRAELILFDLSGSGPRPVEWLPDGVILVSGWDDRIFDVMEAGRHATDFLRMPEVLGSLGFGGEASG